MSLIELRKRLQAAEGQIEHLETAYGAKLRRLESQLQTLVEGFKSQALRAAATRPPLPIPRPPRVLTELLRTRN